MLLDLILAATHHVLVFGLAAIIAMELVLLRPGISGAQLRQIARIDLFYGVAAGLIVLVGFARVFFGLKGPEFYLQNWVFWAKIGTFAMVGLLSVSPTFTLLAWRKAAKADPAFVPAAADVASVKRLVKAEAHLFIYPDLRRRHGARLRAVTAIS